MLDRLIDRIADRVVEKLAAQQPKPVTVEQHYYHPPQQPTMPTWPPGTITC